MGGVSANADTHDGYSDRGLAVGAAVSALAGSLFLEGG